MANQGTKTRINTVVDNELIRNYFKSLVNNFFKILPMRENEESSLTTYLESLQSELAGAGKFIPELDSDARLLSLLAILEFLKDNPDYPVNKVRREVFKAISICNKLKTHYMEALDDSVEQL